MRLVGFGSLACVAALSVTSVSRADDRYFESSRASRESGCDGDKTLCYDLFSTHKENYFLTGFDGATEVKYQFSAKYNLWPNDSPSSVHLSYTQKSKWDLFRPSAPFGETNYNPELFYTYEFRGRYVPDPEGAVPSPSIGSKRARCAFDDARGGAEHESNGLGGSESRGWNRIYLEGFGGCDLTDVTYVALGLKVWAPPFFINNNPDISKYLGSGDLTARFGAHSGKWYGAAEIEFVARKGWRVPARYGSLETNFRWRLGSERADSKWRLAPYFFAQWFTGYGETLLDYDNAASSFRIGFGASGEIRLSK